MPGRVDDNQVEIVKTLRKMGVLVHVTSDLGNGFPDLVVSFKGKLWLVEIKDGKKAKSRQKLTEKESEFHSIWAKHICIINSIDQAIDFVNSGMKP